MLLFSFLISRQLPKLQARVLEASSNITGYNHGNELKPFNVSRRLMSQRNVLVGHITTAIVSVVFIFRNIVKTRK